MIAIFSTRQLGSALLLLFSIGCSFRTTVNDETVTADRTGIEDKTGMANKKGSTEKKGITEKTGTTSDDGVGSRDKNVATNFGSTPQTALGSFPNNPSGIVKATFEVDGIARSVAIYRPDSAVKKPPLLILFHGTGDTAINFMQSFAVSKIADKEGFIVVAPQAVYGRMGGPDDVDHWESKPFPTGWNLSDKNPNANDDVRLTGSIIDAAKEAYNIDEKRVFTFGFSNGAFFSPFVAFLLPHRIAGFAEHAGGAIRCENRGPMGNQWRGAGLSCADLEQEVDFPKCTGALKPAAPPTSGPVPRGYLSHSNDDNIVSVAWTCHLAAAMGENAEVNIVTGIGHSRSTSFIVKAWASLAGHSL